MRRLMIIWLAALTAMSVRQASACTGITLRTAAGETVPARTIEWAAGDLNSCYNIVPRGHVQRSFTPGGGHDGLRFTARYGYVGLSVEQPDFVVEGMNEAGLSAGLFYFPGYGAYEPYDAALRESTLSDLQVVSWILGNFDSIDEMKRAIRHVHIVAVDPRGSTVHWRITERGGRQVVMEIVNRELRFYENTLGVLTNSPGLDWHLTNLNNYVNLHAGSIPSPQQQQAGSLHSQQRMGGMELSPFGGGSGLHGIPGDMTPPSRFIRAAFFQATAPKLGTTEQTVMQAFHILNNFDIPTGIQFDVSQEVPDIPSATQWTVASDLAKRRIYYRTMYNSSVRCIDLNGIDFEKVKRQSAPLDEVKQEPVVEIKAAP